MNIRMYALRLRHDKGHVTLSTAASSSESALAIILNAERAPRRSVQWVKVQPQCDYCDQPATKRLRDGNEKLCRSCAVAQHKDLEGGMTAYARPLRVAQWDAVALD